MKPNEELERALADNLELLRLEIIAKQKANNQWATGRTAAGYSTAVEGMHGELTGFRYTGTLVSGRKPGKTPEGFVDIILAWIEAKGLQPREGETVERMARAIAWSIKRYGSRLYRTGAHVDLFDTAVENFTKKLTDDIGRIYAATVVQNI